MSVASWDAAKRARYAVWVAFIAAIGGFLFGYDLALTASANRYLVKVFELGPAGLGFVTGCACLGCIPGPFLGAWLCDTIGREKTMMVACGLLALSAMFTALAQTFTVFVIFRMIGGLAVGLCSIASPMYIVEVAPPAQRGKLGVMYQLAIVVGSTIAPLACALCVKLAGDESWRWMFASQMIILVFFFGFLFLLPKSPRWLAQKGRLDEAKEVLIRMNGEEGAEKELAEIKKTLAEDAEKTGGIKELFTPALRYAILIACLLAFFNSWTGWSGLGGYIPILIEDSAKTGNPVPPVILQLQFAMTYFVMAIITIISMFTVDKFGRKALWIWGSLLMAIFTAIAGCSYHFAWGVSMTVVTICLCAIPHGLALGPLPWLMMSELFPTRLRGKAAACSTTFLWILIYTVNQFLPMIKGASVRSIGSEAGLFWVFTAICLFSLYFGCKMIPETAGKTLEDISVTE